MNVKEIAHTTPRYGSPATILALGASSWSALGALQRPGQPMPSLRNEERVAASGSRAHWQGKHRRRWSHFCREPRHREEISISCRRLTGLSVCHCQWRFHFSHGSAWYYNPVLGRFISPDSLAPDPGHPQSLNRFSYVRNNPLKLVDPSGHESDEGEGDDDSGHDESDDNPTEPPAAPPALG